MYELFLRKSGNVSAIILNRKEREYELYISR